MRKLIYFQDLKKESSKIHCLKIRQAINWSSGENTWNHVQIKAVWGAQITLNICKKNLKSMSDKIEFYTSKMDTEKLVFQKFSLLPQLSNKLWFNDLPYQYQSIVALRIYQNVQEMYFWRQKPNLKKNMVYGTLSRSWPWPHSRLTPKSTTKHSPRATLCQSRSYMPESTLSSSQELRIWPQVHATYIIAESLAVLDGPAVENIVHGHHRHITLGLEPMSSFFCANQSAHR